MKALQNTLLTLKVRILMTPDKYVDRDMLSQMARALYTATQSLLSLGEREKAKPFHLAIRAVVALSQAGGGWDSRQTDQLVRATGEAILYCVHNPSPLTFSCWLQSLQLGQDVRSGQVRLSDFAGAELYAQPQRGTSRQAPARECAE